MGFISSKFPTFPKVLKVPEFIKLLCFWVLFLCCFCVVLCFCCVVLCCFCVNWCVVVLLFVFLFLCFCLCCFLRFFCFGNTKKKHKKQIKKSAQKTQIIKNDTNT